MKKLVFVLISLVLVSCKEGAKDADAVFKAIEENPARFVEVSRKAFMEAEKKQYEDRQNEEKKKREDEFKNPKQPVVANRPFMGNSAAPITIVEYSDFQCPFCERGSNTVYEVMQKYGDKVKVIFKHLPLEGKHPNARRGSEYFEAIAMQDQAKAFAFKKLVFENQKETYGDAEKLYQSLAVKAGADAAKLKADLASKKDQIAKTIDADMEEAGKFGFQGTPGFLINGVSLAGAYPAEEFAKIIDQHLGKK